MSALADAAPRASRRLALRWPDRAATVALAAASAVLLLLVAGHLSGYRPLVERSGSMEPAIGAGDLLVAREISAHALRTGDVVTFPDAVRPGVLLTHRVVAVRRLGARVDVTTRGDANRTPEQWSIAAGDRVGRLALSVPRLGYVVAALDDRRLRSALILLACAAFAACALRRIWRAR
jgi:signal peptidase